MTLCKGKCWYSYNCLHFLTHAVPLYWKKTKPKQRLSLLYLWVGPMWQLKLSIPFHQHTMSSKNHFINTLFHQFWRNVRFTKCHVDKMIGWQDVKLTKCQVDKMSSWYNVKLTHCQVDTLSSWQIVKLTNCQVDKLSSWQIVNLTNCQVDKMSS